MERGVPVETVLPVPQVESVVPDTTSWVPIVTVPSVVLEEKAETVVPVETEVSPSMPFPVFPPSPCVPESEEMVETAVPVEPEVPVETEA